ncbi:MAG: nicotinate phosphoribosyltransferase [Candidatus Helarchaeales archaeon]
MSPGFKSLNKNRTPKGRLPASVFNIKEDEIRKIKDGFYTDVYFSRSRQIIEKFHEKHPDYDPTLVMNVFSRHEKGEAVVCGLDLAIRIIQTCARGPVEIRALYDGDIIQPGETVMTLKGHLADFIELETVYLGILARGTRIATNTRRVVEVASKKDIPVLFFPARFDLYCTQYLDGYAGNLVGSIGGSTPAQQAWWGGKPLGTIPHALIAFFKPGERAGLWEDATVEATLWFARTHPDVNCISLVDFENDCVETALKVALAFEKEGLSLWGVRLDTSGSLVDASIIKKNQWSHEKVTGVSPILVQNVRDALDEQGFTRDKIKIVVSGGFTEEKIQDFIDREVPFDAVGIGSALFRGIHDFTADIVAHEKNGQLHNCAKVGRKLPEDLSRLDLVE